MTPLPPTTPHLLANQIPVGLRDGAYSSILRLAFYFVDEFSQAQLTGRYIALDESSPRQVWSGGWSRPFGPTVVDLGTKIAVGAETLGIANIDNLPEEIKDRVIRAFYWIAHSTSHATDDHRLVDLCTALEGLLLPDNPYSKAAFVALRYYLLGGTLNPPAVSMLYTLRNHVIHGNPIPWVGPDDVFQLRLVCFFVVRAVIARTHKRPGITSLIDLLEQTATVEHLNDFVEHCDRGIYEGSLLPAIRKAAMQELKKRTVSG